MPTIPQEFVIALISAGSALFGAALGLLGSYRVAMIQFRANVISANRQAWINTLRDTLAEFHSLMLMGLPQADASEGAR